MPGEATTIWGVGGLAWAFLVVPMVATVGDQTKIQSSYDLVTQLAVLAFVVYFFLWRTTTSGIPNESVFRPALSHLDSGLFS